MGRVTDVTNALGHFQYGYVNTSGRAAGQRDVPQRHRSEHVLQLLRQHRGPAAGDDPAPAGVARRFRSSITPTTGTIASWTTQADSDTAVVNTLGYDAADQLVSAVQSVGGSASNAYHYDPAGNRLAQVTSAGTSAGRFNSLNQLKAYTDSTTFTAVSAHTSAPLTSATVNALPADITFDTNFSAIWRITDLDWWCNFIKTPPAASNGANCSECQSKDQLPKNEAFNRAFSARSTALGTVEAFRGLILRQAQDDGFFYRTTNDAKWSDPSLPGIFLRRCGGPRPEWRPCLPTGRKLARRFPGRDGRSRPGRWNHPPAGSGYVRESSAHDTSRGPCRDGPSRRDNSCRHHKAGSGRRGSYTFNMDRHPELVEGSFTQRRGARNGERSKVPVFLPRCERRVVA